MIVHCAHDGLVAIKDLKPNPQNRNSHPKEQIERLAKILDYQGWRYPIKVSKRSGFITSGHGRLEAAKLLKLKEVPVSFQDYTDEAQEYADLTADNAIASWSELDLSGINSDMLDLGPDFDIDLLGIKDFVIEPIEKIEPQCDEDEVPDALPEPKVVKGEVYILGKHRLMCGDSTAITDVERLMDGEKADLLWTDPPYGVSYTDKNKYLNGLGTGHRLTKPIENDHRSPEEMNEFWFTFLSNAHLVMTEKSSYYIASPQGGDLMMMMMMMSIIRSGFQLKHMLIWVKNNHVLGRCDYHYKHEPMLYGWKQNGTHEFFGDGQKKTSVWDFPKPLRNDLHPTMKPVELVEEAILNSTKPNQKVLDLFIGSGTTIIAAEKSNRSAYGMEFDPHYCGVILDRWQKYTGKKAHREDGVAWDEIKAGVTHGQTA